jgi:hypothetical protein
MALTQEEITDISLAVIQEHERSLHLVGVASTEGGSDRIELVITVSGCHDEPCMLMLNLTRAGRSELETELKGKLRTALGAHKTTS